MSHDRTARTAFLLGTPVPRSVLRIDVNIELLVFHKIHVNRRTETLHAGHALHFVLTFRLEHRMLIHEPCGSFGGTKDIEPGLRARFLFALDSGLDQAYTCFCHPKGVHRAAPSNHIRLSAFGLRELEPGQLSRSSIALRNWPILISPNSERVLNRGSRFLTKIRDIRETGWLPPKTPAGSGTLRRTRGRSWMYVLGWYVAG
jgi:hypothetical protein